VEFSVDFTMSSRILHGVVTGLFDYAMRKIMSAFEARAEALYGRQG
jgi:coenzyme Q-binding protein COQ10